MRGFSPSHSNLFSLLKGNSFKHRIQNCLLLPKTLLYHLDLSWLFSEHFTHKKAVQSPEMINTHNYELQVQTQNHFLFIWTSSFKSLSTSCSATGTKDLSWNPDVPSSSKRSSAGSFSTSFCILRVSIAFMVVSYHSKPRILCVCVHLFFVCFSLLLVLSSCFTQNFVCLAQIKSDSAGEI